LNQGKAASHRSNIRQQLDGGARHAVLSLLEIVGFDSLLEQGRTAITET